MNYIISVGIHLILGIIGVGHKNKMAEIKRIIKEHQLPDKLTERDHKEHTESIGKQTGFLLPKKAIC
jgi:hypothetical protein